MLIIVGALVLVAIAGPVVAAVGELVRALLILTGALAVLAAVAGFIVWRLRRRRPLSHRGGRASSPSSGQRRRSRSSRGPRSGSVTSIYTSTASHQRTKRVDDVIHLAGHDHQFTEGVTTMQRRTTALALAASAGLGFTLLAVLPA